MSRRIGLGLVLLVAALGGFIAAGAACFAMGVSADATGTGGYIPPVAWVTGVFGVVALIVGIAVLNGRPRAE